jgi:hypothetical protein
MVGDSSIELSSRSKPAEHVGSHSGGVFGCLAELGSDGIAGVTTALLSGCEALLQALKSAVSTGSIRASLIQLLLGFCICFLRRGLSPLVFLNDEHGSTPVALGHFGAVVGQFALCTSGYRLSR